MYVVLRLLGFVPGVRCFPVFDLSTPLSLTAQICAEFTGPPRIGIDLVDPGEVMPAAILTGGQGGTLWWYSASADLLAKTNEGRCYCLLPILPKMNGDSV